MFDDQQKSNNSQTSRQTDMKSFFNPKISAGRPKQQVQFTVPSNLKEAKKTRKTYSKRYLRSEQRVFLKEIDRVVAKLKIDNQYDHCIGDTEFLVYSNIFFPKIIHPSSEHEC